MGFRKSQLNELVLMKETAKIDFKNDPAIPVKITESNYQQISTDLQTWTEIIKSKSRSELEMLLLPAIDFFGESVNDFLNLMNMPEIDWETELKHDENISAQPDDRFQSSLSDFTK